ncbi:chromosome segregation protein [compost metagenome]
MTPLSLLVDRFRSFAEPQEFAFPSAPGLYFMTGDNLREPRLGSNGAGKSTLWEALTWCFYNKTSRGLKSGDVCSWGHAKGTRVAFAFEAPTGEGTVRMTRQWGPIRHYAEHLDAGIKEDLSKGQDFVLGWLGLGYEQFLHCVLMAQGEPMFLDLKPEPRAALFAGILGLDKWVERSAKASRMAADEDARLRRLEADVAAADAYLRALGNGVDRRAADRWERERQERMDALDREYDSILEYSYAKEDLAAAQKAEDTAFNKMRAAEQFPELRERLDGLKRDLLSADREYAVLGHKYEAAEDQMVRAEKGGDCEACGHPLDDPLHVRQMQQRFAAAREKLARESKSLKEARGLIADCERELSDKESRWRELRDAAAAARDVTAKARRNFERETDDLKRIETEHERLRISTNPHRADAERAQKALDDAQKELREARRGMDASARRHSLLALWVRGFKEVRLQEMSDALAELEVEVNSACAALGLIGWDIRFSVDRETKSGSLSRGFAATVSSPGGGEAVPWEAWSGGEAQRLRLAAQMGLADMIRGRTACQLALEVWDEPTQGLNAQGTQDLLEVLAERAQAEQRQIWVVDHNAHAFGGFSGGAVVVKESGGSRIERW